MKNNGGPAFPFMPQVNPGEWATGQSGMTMRQWYKGMALQGLCMQVVSDYSSGVCNADLMKRAAVLADRAIAEDREAEADV